MQIISGKIACLFLFFLFFFHLVAFRSFSSTTFTEINLHNQFCVLLLQELFVLGWAVFCSQRFKTALVYYFSCGPCRFLTSQPINNGSLRITRFDCAAGFGTQRHFSLKIEEAWGRLQCVSAVLAWLPCGVAKFFTRGVKVLTAN